MKAALIPCALTLLLAAGITSCKKDDEESGNCRIATAHVKIGTTYDATTKLTYDTLGRVINTLVSGSASNIRTFTYKGDTTLIQETNGTAITNYKIARNSGGNIKFLIRYATGTSNVDLTVRYDYNNSGKVYSQTVIYGTGTPDVSTTSYNAAGDATTSKNPASTSPGFMYDYFTDQEFQTGDPSAIINFLNYGAHAVTNTHLLRTRTSQNSTGGPLKAEYIYTYGAGGKITKATETQGTNVSTYEYTYSCE